MEIVLSIPSQLSYSYGLKLIEKKYDWIEKKLIKYSITSSSSEIYYLGKVYLIKTESSHVPLKIQEKYIIFNSSKNYKFILNQWYFEEIKRILEEYLEKYTSLMRISPNKIKIKPLKSAWGICYSSGTITFNLNLIKTPLEIIEYLVVHELGHLKYPNHSKEYWNYIGQYIKNPKSHRKWLRINGHKFI